MTYRWSLATLVLVAACGSKDSGTPAPDQRPKATVDVRPPVPLEVHHFDTPPVKLPSQKAFALIEAGKAPTTPLRYTLAPGQATFALATRLVSRRLAGGTWGPKQTLPELRTAFAMTVEGGKPIIAKALPGEIVGKATPETDQYLAPWKAIEGRPIAIPIDDRGQLGEILFGDDTANTHSAGAIDELTQRFLAVLVPLPEEAVGIGAKWRVVTVLRQRPAIVKQTATYTLLARTAKSWKIGVQIARVGEEQLLLDPSIPDGTVLDLAALLRKFDGTLTVDPTQPIATGSLTFSSTIHIRIRDRTQGRSEEIVDDSGSVSLSKR